MATGGEKATAMKKNLEELKKRFQSVDKDGSGKISYRELKGMVKDLNLTDEEIQDTFDAIDIDGNGWISVTEFCSAMYENSVRNNMEKEFKAMDPDGKGTLSKEEALKVAQDYDCILTQDELEAAFTLADRDGDGIITYKKFIDVLRL